MDTASNLSTTLQTPQTRSWWARNWSWIIPVALTSALILFAAFFGSIVLIVTFLLKTDDVYKGAMQKAKKDERVSNVLGNPVSEARWLFGTIDESGGVGNADLTIPFYGPKGGGTLYVTATKAQGYWTYNKLRVYIKSTGQVIDLQR